MEPTEVPVESHEPFPWNGGWRCRRCGQRIAARNPREGPPCTPIRWAAGTYSLRHVAGPPDADGEQWCRRCGDPAPIRIRASCEYIVTDENAANQSGELTYSPSARYAQEWDLKTVLPCDGSGSVDAR